MSSNAGKLASRLRPSAAMQQAPPDGLGLEPISYVLDAGIVPDAIQGDSSRPVDDIADALPMPKGGACTRPGTELHFSTAFASTTPAGRVALMALPCPNRSDGTLMFVGVDTSPGGGGIVMLETMHPANFGGGVGTFPVFAFDSQSKAVSPGASATFHVKRLGFADVAVTVVVKTLDDSAISGVDFTPINSTLSFASGEVDKTVTVVTIDHGQAGVKRFFLVLQNPQSGALLEFPSQAEIAILGSY